MFWVGFGVGAVVGATLGMFVIALCMVSKGKEK